MIYDLGVRQPGHRTQHSFVWFHFHRRAAGATLRTMDQATAPQAEVAAPEPAARGSHAPHLWLVLAIFVLYPMSTGPFVRLAVAKPKLLPALETLYRPIEHLCHHSEPVRKSFNWYIRD